MGQSFFGVSVLDNEKWEIISLSSHFTTLEKEGLLMLWTILIVLLVLWLLGVIGGIAGNLIHLLLVIALIVLIVRLVQGRGGL
ncbi:hypothetical protein HLI_14565 [Halobacillus litoralis]|uniref:Lmo0937 family membrane protein n=1 Tax=Halobacillus litoralis TaxID=45668 RepID=A0A410MF84_9BACI|nr:hypothetical protein HLI_14565 [Halobacillus litoralis]